MNLDSTQIEAIGTSRCKLEEPKGGLDLRGKRATVGCAVRASKVRIVQECNLQVRASKVPHDESKYFTDKLGPLKRWLDSQVGRNWALRRAARGRIAR